MDINSFLNDITLLYNKHDAIREQTGERYNIFKILRMESSEVKLHSAFLANLLDSDGSHGQKDSFIRAFIEEFGLLEYKDLDNINSKAKVEEHIGYINDDYTTGGRIDLVIHIVGCCPIIIENKIYAGDQFKQLVRYHERYPDANLLYLTLDGKKPDERSIIKSDGKKLKDEIDFQCISYKEGIISWLEKSKDFTTSNRLLHETIQQYINLLKHLTGQTMNEGVKSEVAEAIASSGTNTLAAITVSDSLAKAKKKLLKKFAMALQSKLDSKYFDRNFKSKIDDDFGGKFKGIYFWFEANDHEYIQLSFINEIADFYLEVYNDNNDKGRSKNREVIKYYKEKLAPFGSSMGKVEDANRGWHGDWVCRYHKLENHFRQAKNWSAVADNQFDSILEDVANDVSILIDTMAAKPTFVKTEETIFSVYN